MRASSSRCCVRGPMKASRFTIRRKKLERLADEFFALLPQRRRIRRIERIPAYSLAYSTDGHVIRHDIAHVAVLAVSAADFLRRRHHSRPHRRGRTLLDRLPLKRPFAFRGELIV